jgi:hypothetical protein
VSDTRWKGAPAGMGYGFAFNDHLQALTAAAKAKMAAKDASAPPEQPDRSTAEAPSRS